MQNQFVLFAPLIASVGYLLYRQKLLTQRMAQIIHAGNRHYRDLFEHSSDAVFIVKVLNKGEFRFEMLNPAAMQAIDPNGDDLPGMRFDEIAGRPAYRQHRPALQALAERLRHAVETGMPVKHEGGLRIAGNGDARTYDMDFFPMRAAHGLGDVLCFARDITANKAAVRQFQEIHDKLRELATHREARNEDEHRRIAGELHEELGQLLAVIKWRVSCIPPELSKDSPSTGENIQDIIELTDQSIHAVRKIISKLSPGVLEHGPAAALGWLIAEFQQPDMEIKLLTNDTGERVIDMETTTLVFRIAEELLENLVRQARASSVLVAWSSNQDGYCLSVRDDREDDIADLGDAEALALFGIKERISAFGGEMRACSTPGHGTVIEIRFPG